MDRLATPVVPSAHAKIQTNPNCRNQGFILSIGENNPCPAPLPLIRRPAS